MNPEIKQKWLVALRSGEYTQGRGALREGNSYCCLGVLCEIYRKETQQGDWKISRNEENSFYFVAGNYKDGGILPVPVVEWAGLGLEEKDYGKSPYIKHNNIAYSLSSFNDRGEKFETIANLIEEQL